MAHYQQLKFVSELSKEYPDFFNKKKVLEIGSWITNGSVRDYFQSCDYIGADIAQGPGVDVVTPGQLINFDGASFDTVISCECFEHNPFWLETLVNMIRMLKPGGMCIVSCATLGRKEHGTKRTNMNASLTALNDDNGDYYRNLSKRDFEKKINLQDTFSNYHFFFNAYSRDLYFFGFKKPCYGTQVSKKLIQNINNIKREREANFLSNSLKNIKFWLIYFYALLLGEKKYHDNRFRSGSIKDKPLNY